MTAIQLIADIFSRVQKDMPSNMRRVTAAQLSYARNLIEAEDIPGEVRPGMHGSLVWTPAGRDKFILTEDRIGHKHTITKLSNLVESKSGALFG